MNLDFKFLSEENVYPSKYLNVVKQFFVMPNGIQKSFEVHKGGEVVIILPLTNDNKVVCVTQYRVGPKKLMTELPGGFVDEGETPLQAAERELLEETGFKGDLIYVQTIFPDSYSTIKRHIFVAKNATKNQEPSLDESEFLEIDLLNIKDFRAHLFKGQLTHLESAYLAMDFLKLL